VLLFQSAAIVLLLCVCTFAPGFFIVRRFRWSAMETLCASVALSLVFLWLAAWALYLVGVESMASYGVSGMCVLLGTASLSDFRKLLAIARVRRALTGFAFLFGWTLLALAVIRVYNGAGWRSDWLEHFQRTLFFLHRFPLTTAIFGNYTLPARPPAENVLAAFFLDQVSDRFELFQIVFAWLNLLVFLPCAAALRRLSLIPLVGLFATSPIIMQNATYTWTKLLTAFFVITALLFYLKGWRRNDSVRIVFAFACLAMGMLVHYSGGPYIVFFALHYLIAVWPHRPGKWRELALIATASCVLLATWFGWSIATYGLHTTVASNTSITSSQEYQGGNLGKIAGNIVDTLIPYWLRDPALTRTFDQPNQTAALRDNIFITYQTQLLFTMGIFGGVLVVWLVIRAFRRPWKRPPERTFWLWLIVASVAMGLAVVGERDLFGSAHLTLLPMEALGLTLLAARFRTSRVLAILILAGCAIDFGLGVFLHLRVEHLENTPTATIFPGPVVMGGQVVLAPAPEGLSDSARDSWTRKHQLANHLRWKNEIEKTDAAGKPEVLGLMDQMIAEDARLFHGWYARHGGDIEYLGDHSGASDIPSGLLAILCVFLLWRMAREIPPAAAIAVRPAKAKAARARAKR
jgi:hypothetical protein